MDFRSFSIIWSNNYIYSNFCIITYNLSDIPISSSKNHYKDFKSFLWLMNFFRYSTRRNEYNSIITWSIQFFNVCIIIYTWFYYIHYYYKLQFYTNKNHSLSILRRNNSFCCIFFNYLNRIK